MGGKAVLDLDYAEDSTAEADANFVLAASGGIVEIQLTAEQEPLNLEDVRELERLAAIGITELVALQRAALAGLEGA